jgi:hypothetical protein
MTTLATASVSSALPAAAAPHGHFADPMRMTPEEGPIDPAIQRHYTA